MWFRLFFLLFVLRGHTVLYNMYNKLLYYTAFLVELHLSKIMQKIYE